MKRLAFFLLAIAHASAALAFNPERVPADRIGILDTVAAEDDLVTLRVAATMRGYLARELKKAGFEAVETRATFEEVLETDRVHADYLVEFVYGDSSEAVYGGLGVGGRHGGVDLGIGSAYVAATLRLYDGWTLDLIDEIRVEASDRAVVPTSIGIGTRGGGIWVGIPVRMIRSRAVAREAARDAAQSIAAVLRGGIGSR